MSNPCNCSSHLGYPHKYPEGSTEDDFVGDRVPPEAEVPCKEKQPRSLTLAERSIVKFFEGLSLVAGAYAGYFLAHFVRQHLVGCFVLLIGSIFFRVFFGGNGNAAGVDRGDA